MLSFKSILDDVGKGLKAFFTGAVDVAEDAEPFVDTVFPGVSTLFNSVVTAVANAEGAAIAAGSQAGTGTQKLALVLNSVEQSFNTYATENGAGSTVQSAANKEAAVNAVVAFLNSLEATGVTTTPIATSSTSTVPVAKVLPVPTT